MDNTISGYQFSWAGVTFTSDVCSQCSLFPLTIDVVSVVMYHHTTISSFAWKFCMQEAVESIA